MILVELSNLTFEQEHDPSRDLNVKFAPLAKLEGGVVAQWKAPVTPFPERVDHTRWHAGKFPVLRKGGVAAGGDRLEAVPC